jgi:pimeloyl-ACP methyl ester carboxylesterase
VNAVNADGPSRTVKSRGYTISYEDSGTGPALLIVPGYMQSAADYRRAGYVEHLAGRRVLIIDPLGHGRSDKPYEAAPYRAPEVAADLVAVLDAANLERATLWGYSRGAWLASMAAIEFPRRLHALILGGAGLTQPPPTAVPPWVDPLSRGDWNGFWSLFPMSLTAELKRHFEASNDPKALAAERIGRIESAYVFDLSRVSVPALVYCGSDDGPDEAVPTAKALKTDLRVLAGCDHVAGFKEAATVVDFVVPFLERLG